MAGRQREASNTLKAYLRSASSSELPSEDVPQILRALKTVKSANLLKDVVKYGLEHGASGQARHFADLALARICNLLRKEREGMYLDR